MIRNLSKEGKLLRNVRYVVSIMQRILSSAEGVARLWVKFVDSGIGIGTAEPHT